MDRTISVDSQIASYKSYFQTSVVPSFAPGQRVLIESISDEATLGSPPLRAVDTTLAKVVAPDFKIADDYGKYNTRCKVSVSSQSLAFETSLKNVRESAQSAFVPLALAKNTFILDAIEDAADFLKHGPSPKRLVLFTDGIEDSFESGLKLKFDESGFWQRNSIPQLLSELRGQHRISDLTGAHVYFVGASAKRPEQYRANQAFWVAYFQAAGVAATDLHYGHQPSWDEPSVPSRLEDELCSAGELR